MRVQSTNDEEKENLIENALETATLPPIVCPENDFLPLTSAAYTQKHSDNF